MVLQMSHKMYYQYPEIRWLWLLRYLPWGNLPSWLSWSQTYYFDISVRNSLLPQFLNRASFSASVASSTGEMANSGCQIWSQCFQHWIGVYSFLWLWRLEASGQTLVFPSCAALLLIPLSTVRFFVLRSFIIWYINSFPLCCDLSMFYNAKMLLHCTFPLANDWGWSSPIPLPLLPPLLGL